MSAAVDEGTELLDDTRLDDEPACQDGGYVDEPDEDCPRPAVWRCRMRCGHSWLVCEEHHAEVADDELPIHCPCGRRTLFPDQRWSRL